MRIEHITQLLPAIEGRSEFVVAKRDGYTVIDYNYQATDSFADERRLECRGIKFDTDGFIIARPFRKFFNLGEKQQPHELNLRRPHVVLEKLDGSMIHPAYVGGELVLMTRMGVTDHARRCAEVFLKDRRYVNLCHRFLKHGVTPVFEWTAPDNRIVVPYTENRLTLLGARYMVSGINIPMHNLAYEARFFNIPIAQLHGPGTLLGLAALVDHTRQLRGEEGYVVRFEDDGHAVKIKADEYVLRHRAKSDLDSRRKVLDVVLAGGQDDFALVLDAHDSAELLAFADLVNREVDTMADRVFNVAEHGRHVDRKTFALKHADALPVNLKSCAFSVLDGKHTARESVALACGKHNDLLQATWRGMAA